MWWTRVRLLTWVSPVIVYLNLWWLTVHSGVIFSKIVLFNLRVLYRQWRHISMIVTSQLPIQTEKIFYRFLDVRLCPPTLKKVPQPMGHVSVQVAVAATFWSGRDAIEGIYLLLASFRALLLHCASNCLRVNLVPGFSLVPNFVHLGADRCWGYCSRDCKQCFLFFL